MHIDARAPPETAQRSDGGDCRAPHTRHAGCGLLETVEYHGESDALTFATCA